MSNGTGTLDAHKSSANATCRGCAHTSPLPIPITMAFQPIFDLSAGRVYAYEALVRGKNGESAAQVIASITPDLLYRFDQDCRIEAIRLAGQLMPRDDDTKLSINFMPNAVYEPKACIRASLIAAKRARFAPDRLMFEFTENEEMTDISHVRRIIDAYRTFGFTTAIDDFGAGYSGLNRLADLRADLIKVDMSLVRGIDVSVSRKTILGTVIQLARTLGMRCVVEGVETKAELEAVRNLGADLIQGYVLAKPEVESLPQVSLPT